MNCGRRCIGREPIKIIIFRERLRNSNVRQFSWRQNQSASRLDFWLIPNSRVNHITHADIIPSVYSVYSDHSVISITMNALQSRRGKGFWKFNNTLLADETYCSGLIERIHSVLKENVELSPCTKWEFLKMNVSQHTIQFSKSKRERELKMEKELQESMLELESKSLEVPKVNDELNVIKKGLRFKGALYT